MSYARQIGQEVHLSTQLNISNVEALRFYAQFADVVVLARELNLEQVAEIYRHICEENICGPSGERIRIEMFCHGALCMAVSGKCYLSLDNTGRFSVYCKSPLMKTWKMENKTYNNAFTLYETENKVMREFGISVSYRFGSLTDTFRKIKRGIVNDDVKDCGGKDVD